MPDAADNPFRFHKREGTWDANTGKRRLIDPRFFERKSGVDAEPVVAFRATPKQAEFMRAVQSGRYKYLAIGGGIRGTKTVTCLATLVTLARLFPRSRWAVVRRDLPTLRRNVVPSMEKVRLWSGGFVGPLNQSTWSYRCANGSEVLLFPEQFVQDPELERWKGLEVNGFDAEEANELNEKTANKMIERAGSWIIPGTPDDPDPRQPPPLILCNFNPCVEWPRRWFFEPHRNGTLTAPYYFLPATILDNPFASEDYKDSLKNLPPEEYARFVLGEWDFVDDPRQLIKSEWIWNARNIEPVDGPNALGGDIARYGDDWSKLYKIKGNALRTIWELKHFDLTTVAEQVLRMANDPADPTPGLAVKLDGVGLGAGVIDYCRKKKLPVTEIIAGAKPVPRGPTQLVKFKNLRSQIWWEGREKLRLGTVSLDLRDGRGQVLPIPEKLVGDLASVHYEIDGDRMVTVESKDDIKKRLGRSPDDGDAYMMALFEAPPPPRRPVLPGSFIARGA